MANHLAKETSPYLLQHADNPVDWYPWGEEALARARADNKPIFLSIGYSACHWCHVMAHESFEDEHVAALLNEDFVSVKVDREERPDLDRLYMAAVQALTGSGGWPLSVFLVPDGRPFYGGTYFPPVARHGLPSFGAVLRAVGDAWRKRQAEVLAEAGQIHRAILQSLGDHLPEDCANSALDIQRRGAESAKQADHPLDKATLVSALERLRADYDERHGGWGAAQKFPQPMTLEFLLRQYHARGDPELLHMVTQTLEAMARGGVYDQLGGGFHRYSVDDRWTVRHFEKMLYDNAQLARVYLHAWQVTGNPFFRTVTEETLDYALREMADPQGGFYASQDADSEGQEGRFFLWTLEEVQQALGEQAQRLIQAYGVAERGVFEGLNVLSFGGSPEDREELSAARRQLLLLREQRPRPARDDKVLASWNGLMLAALAEAAQGLARGDYLLAAERNAGFLLDKMRRRDGRLWHTWKAGQARINGFLEDYTYLIEGLLALYQATFESRWLTAAGELADLMLVHFRAPTGFYDTSDEHETLIARPRELQDNAVPSGNALGVLALLRLGDLTGAAHYSDWAQRGLCAVQPLLERYPLGFAQWLIALDYALAPRRTILVVGDPRSADTLTLLKACTKGYYPHQVVIARDPTEEGQTTPLSQKLGLERSDVVADLAGSGTRAIAYVRDPVMSFPAISDVETLRQYLERRQV